jgi:hypothetical protein
MTISARPSISDHFQPWRKAYAGLKITDFTADEIARARVGEMSGKAGICGNRIVPAD